MEPVLFLPDTTFALTKLIDTFLDDNLESKRRGFAGSLVVKENGDFEYKVDASGFRPDELKVDLEGDDIIIMADHEAKNDREMVMRHFTRRVRVPEHIQKDSIQVDLDKRGHLLITGHGGKVAKPKRIPIYRVFQGRSLNEGESSKTKTGDANKII